GMTRAPWAITTIVSCLPVLVLGMGTALAHMLRADAETTDATDGGTGPPSTLRSMSWSPADQDRPDRGRPRTDQDRSPIRDQYGETPGSQRGGDATRPGFHADRAQADLVCDIARRLTAAGKRVSRRALRNGGARGSNEALNALARVINNELAGPVPPRAPAG